MHIVIVGAGRVGFSLARWLVSAGHEIAVIEEDSSRCSALDETLGSVSVLGSCVEPGVLAKAGANRADVLVATSSRDDVNLVACQLARHHFGVPRTISVVNVHDHAELFTILGIDMAIDETELLLGRIQEGLSSHGSMHLMRFSNTDTKTLVSIRIPREYGKAGRALKDISLPDETLISLVITTDGSASIPNEDTLVRAGDEVVAVTTAEGEEKLRDLLIEGSEE